MDEVAAGTIAVDAAVATIGWISPSAYFCVSRLSRLFRLHLFRLPCFSLDSLPSSSVAPPGF